MPGAAVLTLSVPTGSGINTPVVVGRPAVISLAARDRFLNPVRFTATHLRGYDFTLKVRPSGCSEPRPGSRMPPAPLSRFSLIHPRATPSRLSATLLHPSPLSLPTGADVLRTVL
jgi:hypothetical protein